MRWSVLLKITASVVGLFALAASCVSCSDIQLLDSGICGNFVIDLGEDCDGHPLEKGTQCAAPEKPNACRQICSDLINCPTGWGCGNDGLCRHASGSFAQRGDALPLAAPIAMYSGDFDGDKASDLLLLGHENSIGTRSARLAFSHAGPGVVDLRTLAEGVAAPAVTDIDADNGPLDIAFATPDGISLLRGTQDRSTEYGVFPFFNVPQGAPIRIVPTNVFPDIPGDELIAFVDHPNEKSTLGVFQGNSVEPLITLTQGVEAIAGSIGLGRFEQNAPCERLVFAYRGANEVLVYSPCRTDGSSGWNVDGIPTAIKLPPGASIDNGVLVADLDHDNWIDILIGTNTAPLVAWGNGDGTFTSDKSNGMVNTAGLYPLPAAVAANPEFPLAVADLNADQKIDYVFSQGVLVSNSSGYAFAYKNLGTAWTAAFITDLNANKLDDVIAASSEASDLNFLNNAGAGVFNPSTLPTVSPVSLLAVGDFDGDLIRDVAVVQSFPIINDKSSNTLSIGFGQSFGPPADLMLVGEIENATQIVPATIPDPESDGAVLDGITDLIAVDQHIMAIDGSTTPLSHTILFRGNGSRALHTSRPLTDGDKTSRPLSIAIARFLDQPPEIAALGADTSTGELRFWTIESGEADLARPGPILPTGFHPLGNAQVISFQYGAYMATGDLNHDGTDEIVIIAPFGTAADGAAVLIADFQETEDTFLPRTPETISASLSIDNRFELHDVDGDGHLDGVLSTGSDEDPGDLIVLWGDGNGKLLTNAPDYARPEGGVRGFACLPEIVGCRLVLASSSGTYSTTLHASRRLELTRIDDLPESTAIATGDFDGDGVVDIALHAQNGVTIYRSLPVIE